MSAPERADVQVVGGVHVADAADVVDHLRGRGILGIGPASVEALSGGVSNDVLAVWSADASVVVKRALPRLRVAEEWLADPDRVLIEAQALSTAGRVQPDVVPAVLDVDSDRWIIVIERAPLTAREWKSDLLDGVVDLDVATRLGTILGTWHRQTAGAADVARTFAAVEAFGQLRVDPFYTWVGGRHPDLAPAIDAVARRMADTRACLVHGDFSPKNVLLAPDTTWIIDWEVAHYGDPSFDVAFLVTHLLCKALHRPASTPGYRDASDAFRRAYGNGLPLDDAHLAAQTACLLLARMDGKSPVPYLDDGARDRGRDLARCAIAEGVADVDELWRRLQ